MMNVGFIMWRQTTWNVWPAKAVAAVIRMLAILLSLIASSESVAPQKKTRRPQKDILSKHMVDNFEPSTQSLAPPSDENVDKIIIVIIAAAIKTEWTKRKKKTYRQIVVSNQWLIIVSEAFRVSSRTTDDSSPTHTQFTVGSYAHRQQHNGRNTPKIAKEKGSDDNNNTNDNRTTTKK